MKSHDGSWVRFRAGLVTGALVATAAVGVGVVSFVLPVTLLTAVVLGACALVCLIAARRYVHGLPVAATASATALESADTSPERDDLRAARAFYYLGMLTLAQTAFRPFGVFTLSDWAFFASLCAVLLAATARRGKMSFFIPPVILLGCVLYVVSGLIASVGAVDPALSVALVARFAYLSIVWFWLGTVVLTKQRHVRTAMAIWVVSVAIDGVAAMLQAKGVSIPFADALDAGRMNGMAESVNALGGAAAVAVAPAFALIATASRSSRQVAWIVVLFLIVVAIILSGSVTAMAAGIAAAGVWLVLSYRTARTLVVALAALTLAAGVAQVQSDLGLPTPVQRLLSTTGQSEGGRYSTVAMRVQGYDAAWEAFGSGGWIGHGLIAGFSDASDARYVHNVMLKAWYEAGWTGGVGMACVLFGGLAYTLVAARRALTEHMRLLAVSTFGGMVAFVLFAMSNPLVTQRYGWVPLALATALLSLSRRHASECAETGVDAAEPAPSREPGTVSRCGS